MQAIVSIIVPHFESVEKLKRLLSTAPRESGFEIIVIDDKSVMEERAYYEMSRSSEYRHAQFLHNDTNAKGAGVCRNIGMSVATGEWLLFADADDFFSSSVESNIKGFINSDYDLVFFKVDSVCENIKTRSDRHLRPNKFLERYLCDPKTKKNELAVRYKMHGPCAKLIKKSFVERNKIEFDHTKASNDVMFSTKVGAYANRFYVSKNCFYTIVKNRNSLTETATDEVFFARLLVNARYHQFLNKHISYADKKELNLRCAGFVADAFRRGPEKGIKAIKIYKRHNVSWAGFELLNPLLWVKWFLRRAVRKTLFD